MPDQNPEGQAMRQHDATMKIEGDGGHGIVQKWSQDRLILKVWFHLRGVDVIEKGVAVVEFLMDR